MNSREPALPVAPADWIKLSSNSARGRMVLMWQGERAGIHFWVTTL